MKPNDLLPECLTIMPSEINGLGLFSKGNIPAGTNLGISHRHYDCSDTIDRTVIGALYNCPNNHFSANCVKEMIYSTECTEWHLITIKDIPENTELLCVYTFDCYNNVDFTKT